MFKLAPDGTLTTLHAFAGGSDGSEPDGGLIADDAGNLYGTAMWVGGAFYGSVFKLAPDGTLTTLHSFAGVGNDGQTPWAGLVIDQDGNLFGTTEHGGASGQGAPYSSSRRMEPKPRSTLSVGPMAQTP